jgi:hypothetical protein
MRCTFEPSAFITAMSLPLNRVVRNTIFVPSGDHVAVPSYAGCDASTRSLEPSAFIT